MSQLLRSRHREGALTALALLTSTGTLLCCALPVILVTLGLGSAVAGLMGAVPWLVTLSHYKGWVFIVSALLLTPGGWMLHRPNRSCPTDPQLGAMCARLDRWNRRVYWTSVALWCI